MLTDQPEQTANAERVAKFGLRHVVVAWRADTLDFRRQIALAVSCLLNTPGRQTSAQGEVLAAARLDLWVKLLLDLTLKPGK